MNGRSAHDALLRTLCESEIRAALVSDPERAAAALGRDEAAVLGRTDRNRLARLARFMARHFYRERLVRLFRHTRAVLLRAGRDPLAVIDTPKFVRILDGATLGSAESAERVASVMESRCRSEAGDLDSAAVPPYFEDLLTYEGTIFRVEAGPRRFKESAEADHGATGRIHLSPQARMLEIGHDLPTVLEKIADPSAPLPEAERKPTRLLAALDPRGVVNVVRCPDGVARLIQALDGSRSVEESALAAGIAPDQAANVVKQLRSIGAVQE